MKLQPMKVNLLKIHFDKVKLPTLRKTVPDCHKQQSYSKFHSILQTLNYTMPLVHVRMYY